MNSASVNLPSQVQNPAKTFYTIPIHDVSIRLDTVTRVWTTETIIRRGKLHIERTSGKVLEFGYPNINDAELFAIGLRRELEKCGVVFR